jgi:hypothetical protein
VCSTEAAQIARICAAIEELAGRPGEQDGVTTVTAAAAWSGNAHAVSAAADDVAGRLATIWAMIADVDPEIAKRLPDYLAAADRAASPPPSTS